jgi:putative hemolysin
LFFGSSQSIQRQNLLYEISILEEKSLNLLTQINLDDLVNSFGWQDRPLMRRVLCRVFAQPAQTFARQVLDFDTAIKKYGLIEASRRLGKLYVQDIRVYGTKRIPTSAFLALSNHPGLADSVALFCALKRADLRMIALERPFLTALTNLSKQLFTVKEDAASRLTLVRQVSSHLRAGGAVLTFPAGQIEPDPEVYLGAADSLQTWTESAGIFLRMAPETSVLPVLIRNVVWHKVAHHPLLKVKKDRIDRERLAAALQLLATIIWDVRPVTVTVQIGEPITVKKLGSTDVKVIHQAVLRDMKSLIKTIPRGEGKSVF